MKISRTKFIIIFLVSAFAFNIITNLLLQPVNGDWFPGTGSPIAWKRTVAAIIYPVKIVLVGPFGWLQYSTIRTRHPRFVRLACALYWTVIALALHFLLSKMIPRKKS